MEKKTLWPKRIWDGLERIMYAVAIRVFRLKFLEPRWKEVMRFVKFGIVGLSNTMISYVVYLIGISLGMNYLAASILGFVISVVNAFYWNHTYVFAVREGEERSLFQSFVKTFLSYAGTGLVLANILLVIQVRFLNVPEAIAPLINLIITIPLNYVLNKLWAFSSKSQSGMEKASHL